MKNFYIVLICFFVIALSAVFQYSFFENVKLIGTAANAGVVLISAVGLMSGKERGAVLGLCYGLIIDVLEGRTIGVYMLSYILLGYLVGLVGKGFSKENRATLVGIVGVSSILFEVVIYIFGMIFYKYDLDLLFVIGELAKETLYNMLLAIIFYKPLYYFGEIINRTKDKYFD